MLKFVFYLLLIISVPLLGLRAFGVIHWDWWICALPLVLFVALFGLIVFLIIRDINYDKKFD